MSLSTSDPIPWPSRVRRSVAGLRFGSVQLAIRDGIVTSIDIADRTRLAIPPDPPLRPEPNAAGLRKSSADAPRTVPST